MPHSPSTVGARLTSPRRTDGIDSTGPLPLRSWLKWFTFSASARSAHIHRQACQGGFMLRIMLLLTFCLAGVFAAEPVREVTSQASLVAHQLIPRFYNGYLYYLGEGRPSQIRLYAPDGHLVLA